MFLNLALELYILLNISCTVERDVRLHNIHSALASRLLKEIEIRGFLYLYELLKRLCFPIA